MGTLSVREAIILAMDKLKVTCCNCEKSPFIEVCLKCGKPVVYLTGNITDALDLLEEALKEIDEANS